MSDKSVLAAYRNRLGKIPDQKIADQAGVSRTLVVNYRKKLGISAYQGHKSALSASKAATESNTDRPFRGRRSALDPFLGQLGSLPDAEIARLAGVTAENVRTYRQRRNIAPVWQAGDPPVAPPPATATPASRGASAIKAGTVAKAGSAGPKRAPAAPVASVDALPSLAAEEFAEAAAEAAVAPLEAPAEPAQAPMPAAKTLAVSTTRKAPALPSSSASGTAFLVLVDTDQGPRSYALIAADIGAAATAAAARIASRHPGATIRAVQRVAELLPH